MPHSPQSNLPASVRPPQTTGLTSNAKRLAREDISAALNETRYITDPRYAGCVANIQGRLRMALKWIGDDVETHPHLVPVAAE